MLERSLFYDVKTKNKTFKAVFLGSYYKINSSNKNKTACKSCDFITKDGLFISEDIENIIDYKQITEKLSDSLNILLKDYEDKYLKQLENRFLIEKMTKELNSLSADLNNLAKEMKKENNYFTLKDLVTDNWLDIKDVSTKFKSFDNEITLNCTLSNYIYHNEINNSSLSCFEMDITNVNSSIVESVGYKIKDIKTAYKLYNLPISNEIIEKLNLNLPFFQITYKKDFNNLKITDEFVCIDNLINITFNKFTYSYDEYVELKDDLNYCLDELSNSLITKLEDLKLMLKEVVYGVEQEKEFEKQLLDIDLISLFNFNMNDVCFSHCYS